MAIPPVGSSSFQMPRQWIHPVIEPRFGGLLTWWHNKPETARSQMRVRNVRAEALPEMICPNRYFALLKQGSNSFPPATFDELIRMNEALQEVVKRVLENRLVPDADLMERITVLIQADQAPEPHPVERMATADTRSFTKSMLRYVSLMLDVKVTAILTLGVINLYRKRRDALPLLHEIFLKPGHGAEENLNAALNVKIAAGKACGMMVIDDLYGKGSADALLQSLRGDGASPAFGSYFA